MCRVNLEPRVIFHRWCRLKDEHFLQSVKIMKRPTDKFDETL